ncbi:general odorant-binding protein 83a-like [Anthonomus grandis grandis]|uniref:general odorant-binding protein 83a-like n=1 Tax=Anthonomus grandis grandis TaxID=2921223 RepID=UPI0021668123|nr:general odorant-binding protein 83a-like [Anthonomus grandis grandis]
MSKILLCFFGLILVQYVDSRMTDKQLVAAVKLVRNMCTGKTKASPEEIDKMHQGNWDVDYNAQCYMWCSLNMYKLMDKENNFDRKSAEAQMSQLPASLLDYVTKCMDQCEHAAKRLDDKCIAAWEYSKCMYFCDPEQYFLP